MAELGAEVWVRSPDPSSVWEAARVVSVRCVCDSLHNIAVCAEQKRARNRCDGSCYC